MKKFFLRLGLLVVICSVVLMALSRGYLALLNTDYERSESTTLKFEYVPEQIRVACFGSSHAGSGFQVLRYRGAETFFNFSMQQENPIMDAALYQTYQDRFDKGCTVIITLSYFSLYDNAARSIDFMKRYIDFLPVKALPNLKTKLFRLFRIVDFSLEPVFSLIQGKTATYQDEETTSFASNYSEEERASIGKKRSEPYFQQIGDAKLDPEIDAALRGMLADCIEKGYRPVLVTTPYLDEITRNFSDSFLTQFHKECQVYADVYGIPYLDYSQDARFAFTPAYFVDTDHLNSDRSEAFMKIFFDDVHEFYPEG